MQRIEFQRYRLASYPFTLATRVSIATFAAGLRDQLRNFEWTFKALNTRGPVGLLQRGLLNPKASGTIPRTELCEGTPTFLLPVGGAGSQKLPSTAYSWRGILTICIRSSIKALLTPARENNRQPGLFFTPRKRRGFF